MLHPSKTPGKSGNYNHPMLVIYRFGVCIVNLSGRLIELPIIQPRKLGLHLVQRLCRRLVRRMQDAMV